MTSTVTLPVDQGASFTQVVVWQQPNGSPVNLTGYTITFFARGQASQTPFTATQIDVVVLEGKITISISSIDTATMSDQFYDFELRATSPANFVSRLLQGRIKVNASLF